MLPEMKAYEEMKIILIENGFIKVNEPYRLFHEISNTVIDFLPFGEIEEEGTISFLEREIELSVIGMKEVHQHTVTAELGGFSIKVSPLEGIVILKLVSFHERPDRQKDLDDISEIIRNYFDINSERFYSDHLDIVDDIESENFVLLAGARLMGRDMKKILLLSEKLSKQIATTLQNELDEKIGTMTNYFLSKNIFKNYQLIKDIFTQVIKGVNE